MCVNYYSRIRCTLKLMPLLDVASEQGQLSRVGMVLAGGSESDIRLNDLDLIHDDFTLHACLAHCVVMTDFAIEELARRYPGTSFIHSYPGMVKSGLANNELRGPAKLAATLLHAVTAPWVLDFQGSGERQFFQMTWQCYPSATTPEIDINLLSNMSVSPSVDGQPGSGAYLVDWNGKSTGHRPVLEKYRDLGIRSRVWSHTVRIFAEAEHTWQQDSRWRANRDAEKSGEEVPGAIGWRTAF